MSLCIMADDLEDHKLEEEEPATAVLAEAVLADEEATTFTQVDSVRIVPIQRQHLPEVCTLLRESFIDKRCLLCLPVDEALEELQQRYAEMPEAKWKLGAVALNEANHVVGYAQMTTHGLPVYPEDFHTCKRDEMYIEIIAVDSAARGQGIGRKLLEWCHETALANPGMHKLQLEVLRGNPAIRLYERVGFEIINLDNCGEECCTAMIVCCFFGRPYGFCNKEWGSVEMCMLLERQQMD